MKRIAIAIIISVLVILAFVLLVFCIRSNNRINQINSYTAKVRELDAEYKTRYENSVSNVEKSGLCCEMADKWQELSDYYYDAILKKADKATDQQLADAKELWENNKNRYCEALESYSYDEFGAGTIVPLILSKHLYDMNRLRATELCTMLVDLTLQ